MDKSNLLLKYVYDHKFQLKGNEQWDKITV